MCEVCTERTRYKLDSERKLLIHKDFKLCIISVHFGQSLENQGFGGLRDNI